MSFLPIIRPTLPPLAEVEELILSSWESGMVTVGPTVRAFEEEACRPTWMLWWTWGGRSSWSSCGR
jgi:hypothetical protein